MPNDVVKKDAQISVFSADSPDPEVAKFTGGLETEDPVAPLRAKFVIPPFSVLDARHWQSRKRDWIQRLGLRGEEGREDIATANNICSEEWGRGREFYAENEHRVDGNGLSEGQGRINKAMSRYAAQKRGEAPVPGGSGPNGIRNNINVYADKKADPNTYGSGKPGDLSGEMKGKDLICSICGGGKEDHGGTELLCKSGWLWPVGSKWSPRQPDVSEELNVAAEKGWMAAAKHNATLSEKDQRALSAYFAPNGSVVTRGTPMESGLTYGEVPSYDGASRGITGTSVFDPMLCECAYRWFIPRGGHILDPFAGGASRGFVASMLGHPYTGIELRPGQVAANERQWKAVKEKNIGKDLRGNALVDPLWIAGDSCELEEILGQQDNPFQDFDFVFACPPYFDLEIYSVDQKDGSAFDSYDKFLAWYENVFKQAIARLKDKRFAAIVVGEIRDTDGDGAVNPVVKDYLKPTLHGEYRNFEADTILMMRKLGLRYYNRFVLVTAVGSLPVRIGTQFPKYRKCGNTHQMMYVFYKGDNFKDIPNELGVLDGTEYGTGAAMKGQDALLDMGLPDDER